MIFLRLAVTLIFILGTAKASCAVRTYGDDNIVCVCNETFCDVLLVLNNVSSNEAAVYETNSAGARFESSTVKFLSSIQPSEIPILNLKHSEQYQFIVGFGGAFTDAVGINIKSVSTKLQEKILSSYFSENGLEYNMGRVPIASCDFSTHAYSYDDVPGDFDLKHFQLAKEDFYYKIPFIQKAAQLSKTELLLFGSPWSPPAWMKTNNAMNGKGGLKDDPEGKYYQTWANYFVRFLEAYRENNITFWGLTVQNEPTDGCQADFAFQSMCFPPDLQAKFLKLHLGPTLQKSGFGVDTLKLMIMDDNRVLLPRWVEDILEDDSAAQYVSGIAFHWYLESLFPHKLLDITHNKYPNVFFLATEACTGSYPWDIQKVSLGSWKRAERYAHDIIQDLLHWSVGWIDWNLVLNLQGGPNWVKNFVDAPIIVNSSSNEFYKQPMYYALAQFSKCLPRGSFRIGLEIPQNATEIAKDFDIGAFYTPEDKTVVIAVNRKDEAVQLIFHDIKKGYLNVSVNAHAIQTYVW